MANIQAPLKYTVDLDQGAVQAILEKPLATLDSLAHVFSVAVTQGKANVDLTGAKCTGYFIRSDKVTIPIDGTVSGNVASVTLLPNCYAVSGRFFLHVKLTSGSVVHSILRVEGSVQTSRTDAMASGGGAVQSFDQLVETAAHCSRAYNLLDNSDFRNPINQRGQTTYYGGANYCLDRWKLQYNTTLDVMDGYVKLVGEYELSQRNAVPIKAGQAYTIAARMRAVGNVYLYLKGPGNAYTLYTVPNEWHTQAVSGIATENIAIGGCDIAHINLQKSEGYLEIEWVAVYEGTYTADTLPAYQPKGYAAELAECQRYYYPLGSNVLTGSVLTGSAGEFAIIKVPARMRSGVTPTVAINGTLLIRCNGTDYASTSAYIESSDFSGVEIVVSAAGVPAKMAAAAHATGVIALNADL